MAYRRVTYHQFSEKYVKLREKNKIDRNFFTQIRDEFINKSFIQYGYMSTSLCKDPHKSYTGVRYPILLKIILPKDTSAIYIDDISKYFGQYELLVNRNYKFCYKDFFIIEDENIESILAEIILIDN